MLLHGFCISTLPINLIACILGIFFGTLLSIIPIIGTTGTLALFLPLSYHLEKTTTFILFLSLYYGANYNQLKTMFLSKIQQNFLSFLPYLRNYATRQNDRDETTSVLFTIYFFITGLIGVFIITFLTPLLATITLCLGPLETFLLALVSLFIVVKLTGPSQTRSLSMILFGIMISTIGLDTLSRTSRFTFNINELDKGFDLPLLIIGILGIEKLFTILSSITFNRKCISLPSYFSNNIFISLPLIPLLLLGLPLNGNTAVLFCTLSIYGINPNPYFITQEFDFFWGLISGICVVNILIFFINFLKIRIKYHLLKMPLPMIIPFLLVMTLSGIYSIHHNIFDLVLVIIYGIIAFFLIHAGYKTEPFIIGIITGPKLEETLLQTLMIYNENIIEIFYQPIFIIFIIGSLFYRGKFLKV